MAHQSRIKTILLFTLTLIAIISFLTRFQQLEKVEFKDVELREVVIAERCMDTPSVVFIKNEINDSSVGIPQPPLINLSACIFGFLFKSYDVVELMRFQIAFSLIGVLIFLLLIYKVDSSNFIIYYFAVVLSTTNVYQFIMGRGFQLFTHAEIFAAALIFFWYKRDSFKNSFFYGFTSMMLGMIYLITFLWTFSITFTTYFYCLLFKKNQNFNTKGLALGMLSVVPYIMFVYSGGEYIVRTSTSWGLTSYWRTLFSFTSGQSIYAKINHPNDLEVFLRGNIYIDYFINALQVLVIFSFLYFLINILYKIFKQKALTNIELLLVSLLLTYGFFLTLGNRPIYAHYFLMPFPVSGLLLPYVLQNLFNKDKYHLKLFIICFVTLTNLVLTQETLKYLDANNGAHNSDYGKSYNICGCCTNVIKDCRGQ